MSSVPQAIEQAIEQNDSHDAVVCHCLRVTESELRHAVMTGQVGCLKSAIERTGAGSGCTACHRMIREILVDQPPATTQPASASPQSPLPSSPICMAK